MAEEKRPLPAETQVLIYMLDRYRESKSEKDRASVISCLKAAVVTVPVKAAGAPEADGQGKKKVKLTVPLLQNKEKGLFFPVYVTPDQIPEQLRKGQGIVNLPFPRVLEMALAGPGTDGMAVNPFSHNVILSGEELRLINEK